MTSSSKESGTSQPPLTRGLRGHVLETLGQEVCGNLLPAGQTFTTESLEDRFQVSRPVVREALRSLESLGLITPKRRVGMTVQPFSEWNVYDPQVIRWRLAGANRVAQLRSITELRAAVEPAAARMAAVRTPLSQAADLVALAGRLWQAGAEGDTEAFLDLDLEFHSLILEMSGNEMFAKLHHIVAEILIGRTTYGLTPQYPAPEALQLHVDIATAIQSGDADRAAAAVLAITARSLDEMSSIWAKEFDQLPHMRD